MKYMVHAHIGSVTCLRLIGNKNLGNSFGFSFSKGQGLA